MNLSPWLIIFLFATLNEAIIEYLFGSIVKLRPYLPLVSLSTAVFMTFAYQINIFTLILGVQTNSPFLDFLLSGVVISRASNFVNDLAQKILGSK